MIFVSYAREDKTQLETLVAELEKRFEVFWDPDLRIGQTWDDELQRQLKLATWVLVLWSEVSVSSRYVREEAEVGLAAGKLVPVRFEEVEPPFGFRFVQSCDLFDWDGDAEDPAFLRLVEALGQTSVPPPPAPWYSRWWRASRRLARAPAVRAATASLLVVGAAWGFATITKRPNQPGPASAVVGVPRQEQRPPVTPTTTALNTTLPATINPIPSPPPAASSVNPPSPVPSPPPPPPSPKHCCHRLTGAGAACEKSRCADCGLKDCPK